jgi:mannose-1-phosphate guanylyltransferase/phosphomannomutase
MRKAIVMAGGQGSHLWPLTLTRPNPLVPVANRPVIAHIFHWLRSHAVSEVLVTLHDRANDVRRALGDGHSFGLKIAYQVEDEPLGTAGCVKAAAEWIAGESFLIASSDAITDVDVSALREKHRESGAWMTLGLKRMHDPSRYGVVDLDGRGAVLRFQERPGPGQMFNHLVNTGIYCVEPQVLVQIPAGRAVDWSEDIFPRLLVKQHALYGHELHGYWRDIDSIHEYRQGQRDVLEGALRAGVPGIELQPHLWIGLNTHLAPGAAVKRHVLLGPGCRIEPGVLLLPGTVLGPGTVVRRGTCIQGAILGAGCVVGPRALIRNCIVDDQVQIGANCIVDRGAVIGRGCQLAADSRVGAGLRIKPGQVLHRLARGSLPPGSRCAASEPAADPSPASRALKPPALPSPRPVGIS